jgi:hypothetical protein
MAAWQAGFHVVLPGVTLPTDYAERLGRVLPPGSHWDASSERWGIEDGDMIDVSIEEHIARSRRSHTTEEVPPASGSGTARRRPGS